MGNYSDVDRMIILSKLEESELSNHLSPPPPSPPLTTVYYPDDQISAYHHLLASTTPLSTKRSRISSNETYPSNHKRRYSKVHRNPGTDFVTDVMELTARPTTTITKHTGFPEKRMFFPTFDDYDDDFVDVSYPSKANNIQEILNQSTSDDEMENIDDVSDGGTTGVGVAVDMINDLILPSMPFSRAMKVEGIYRREKMKRDQLSTMETAIQTQHMHKKPLSTVAHGSNAQNKLDPFLKFKPSSPHDVNLLAASNMMKLKSYTHHKPRPLTKPSIGKYGANGDFYDRNSDPNVIYNQIISANRNARHEKPMQINTKPFSLMLDVYPMPEDGERQQNLHLSSTRMTPYGSSLNHRRPPAAYPVNSHAINNNLQYNKDSTMYNPFMYPQLQPYPYNRSPYALNPTAKEGYIRNYALQRLNTQVYGSLPAPSPPLSASSSSIHRTIAPSDEMPSQITVHLNLYPDRKKMRNVEIVNTAAVANGDLTTTPTTATTIATSSSTSINDHPHTLWKRLERPITSTAASKSMDTTRKGFIPPFSAIKINSFQHDFDNMNQSASTIFQVKQLPPDKAVDYADLTTFDSKKLLPTNSGPKAAVKSYINPMANSIISITKNPYPSTTIPSSFDNDMPSMSISMASTMANRFASTMPSSTAATASTSTFYTTSVNQIPLISTITPSSIQTATSTPTTTMTNTADDANESKLDQTTTATL